jgi:hypothetical protein
MAFLMVWDWDSYTGSFLVLCCCHAYVYCNPNWFIYQFSSLLPSPLSTVAPASLRFLYSFLYCEHIYVGFFSR